jgi:hypothetical protein
VPRKKRRKGVVVAAAVLAAAAVGIVVVFFFTRAHGSAALDDWIAAEHFEPRRPPSDDAQPGTLLFVSGGKDYVALSSNDFLADGKTTLETGSRRDVDLQLEGSSTVHGATGAKLGRPTDDAVDVQSKGEGSASIHLRGVRSVTLPFSRIADLARQNPRVTAALQRSPDTLFIVTDALVAESLDVTFRETTGTDSDFRSRVAAVRNRLGMTLSESTTGTITSKGPLVLGVRLAQLSVASNVLGGGADKIQARTYTTEEL